MTNPARMYAQLDSAEAEVIRGLEAFERRNELIYELVASGERQADVTRRINAARAQAGADPITPDAVAATLKRVERKRSQR